MNRDHSVVFEIVSKYCILDSFVDYDGYSISSKGLLPTVVDIMVIWVKFTHSSPFFVHWFLKCRCSLLASPVWPLPIHGPNIPGSYVILFFITSKFPSITSHIHSWVLFLFWLCLFILSQVISPLFSSSILGTYWPGEFVFQCPIFLPFHTVHGVFKARVLKWFNISFASGPHFVITLHHDPSVLGGPTWHILSLSWTRLWWMWSVWLVFCDCDFQSVCPLRDKDRRLMEASWWERLTEGETGSCSYGWDHAQ